MKKSLIIAENSVLQANKVYGNQYETDLLTRRSHKIKILVDALRMVSEDSDISKELLLIPDDCEKYGFVEGKHNVGQMLKFFADMLEE